MATLVISPFLNSRLVENLPTLLLGHIAEGRGTNYVGLLPSNTETLSNLLQKYASVSWSVLLALATAPCATSVIAATDPEHCMPVESSPKDLGQRAAGPKQPQLPSFPKTTFGNQNRSFSANYTVSTKKRPPKHV